MASDQLSPTPDDDVIIVGDSFKLVSRIVSDGPVIICFDGWHPVPTLEGTPFGFDFLVSEGMNAVAVRSGANDWYQNPRIDDLLAAIDRAAGPRRRIAYGSSMGGWASVNFSEALNIERVLIFSPQFSVDRTRVPQEERWLADQAKIRFINDRIDAVRPVSGHIFYDPMDALDRLQASLILQRHPLKNAILPFAGHLALEYFAYAGCIRQVIVGALTGMMSDSELAQLRRSSRDRTAPYWNYRAMRMARRGRLRQALADARKATALYTHTDVLSHSHLAEMLYANGETAEAFAIWLGGLGKPDLRDAYAYMARLASRRWGWPDLMGQLGLPPD